MQITSIANAGVNPVPYAGDPQRQAATAGQAQGHGDAQAVPVPSTAVQSSGATSDQQVLQDALKKLNDTVKLFSNSNTLQFSIDTDTRIPLVKVVDTKTKEVIQQIPTEQAVAIAKAIDQFQGMLIKERA
ncbi:flagellar protein FlaG [Andreprevotia chitinilytica]|uniref:flagellar protein FlaG n=1 Tax=Andreprevotia chitinilytica TaxID=396808 RepID=UPI0009FD5215|nr:flagellar protein FlaG [Andreprevotia chitinilytica]